MVNLITLIRELEARNVDIWFSHFFFTMTVTQKGDKNVDHVWWETIKYKNHGDNEKPRLVPIIRVDPYHEWTDVSILPKKRTFNLKNQSFCLNFCLNFFYLYITISARYFSFVGKFSSALGNPTLFLIIIFTLTKSYTQNTWNLCPKYTN